MDPNNKARKCLFCGRSAPEVRMSKEHVYRKHFRSLVETDSDAPMTAVAKFPMAAHGRSVPDISVRPTSPWERTSKNVCRDCNTTVLNDQIEKPAEPTLLNLILGRPATLSRAELDSVALWAAKTAIVRSSAEGPRWVFSDHAQRLGETLRVPPLMTIWLGAAQERRNITDRVNMAEFAIFDARYSITTMWIGKMVLHVLDCNAIAPLMMLDRAARAVGSDNALTRLESSYGPLADNYTNTEAHQLSGEDILHFSDAIRLSMENG